MARKPKPAGTTVVPFNGIVRDRRDGFDYPALKYDGDALDSGQEIRVTTPTGVTYAGTVHDCTNGTIRLLDGLKPS